MPYICKNCRAVFSRPMMIDNSFDHDFGTEYQIARVCPHCQSADIDAAVPCANGADNNGYMADGDIICDMCKRELAKRVRNFLATLTAAEERQLDEWLDGNSIQDSDFLEKEVQDAD